MPQMKLAIHVSLDGSTLFSMSDSALEPERWGYPLLGEMFAVRAW